MRVVGALCAIAVAACGGGQPQGARPVDPREPPWAEHIALFGGPISCPQGTTLLVMDRWNRVQSAMEAPKPPPPRFDDRVRVGVVEDRVQLVQLVQICRADGRCYRPPSAAWCEAAGGRREGPYVTWDEYWRQERDEYRDDQRVGEQEP